MPVTIDDVRSFLDAEEPDYRAAAGLGEASADALARLVEEGDPLLAAKAAYLAGLIPAAASVDVLRRGAASRHAVVRVAVAATIRNLALAGDLLEALLKDEDLGVRRQALISAGALTPTTIRPMVEHLSRADASPRLRELAATVLARFP